MMNPLLVIGGISLLGYVAFATLQKAGTTPSQYAGFYGSGASTLDEEIMPFAGFFGAGSSKLEDPPLLSSFSNARPSAGFLSMSSPIQEDLYGPDRYVPWEQRG